MFENSDIQKFKYYLVCLMEEIGEALAEEKGTAARFIELSDISAVAELLRERRVIFGALHASEELIKECIGPRPGDQESIILQPLAQEALSFIRYCGGIGSYEDKLTDERALFLLHKFASKVFRFEISRSNNATLRYGKYPPTMKLRMFAEDSANLFVFFRLLQLWAVIPVNEEKKERVERFCSHELNVT